MPIFNLTAFFALLAPGQRLIGLDPGRRSIGVALSDVFRRFASPYGTLRRGKLASNAAEISEIAALEGVGGLVVGLPLDEAGKLGPAAQAARDWTHALSAATGLPGLMWDERDTTAEAHALLIGSADMGRKRRAEVVDRMAAAAILQAALDAAASEASSSQV